MAVGVVAEVGAGVGVVSVEADSVGAGVGEATGVAVGVGVGVGVGMVEGAADGDGPSSPAHATHSRRMLRHAKAMRAGVWVWIATMYCVYSCELRMLLLELSYGLYHISGFEPKTSTYK